ncbi:MAG: hypothetical protein ABH842_03900 [Candidatus Micrarchaeota archaeon]
MQKLRMAALGFVAITACGTFKDIKPMISHVNGSQIGQLSSRQEMLKSNDPKQRYAASSELTKVFLDGKKYKKAVELLFSNDEAVASGALWTWWEYKWPTNKDRKLAVAAMG